MERSKNFFKLLEKPNGKLFWNFVLSKAAGGNKIDKDDKEYDITHEIQNYFTNTNPTTKLLNNNDKMTVYGILKDVSFHDMEQTKGLKSARKEDVINNLTKAIENIINHLLVLPPIEHIKDLEGEIIEKMSNLLT